MFESKEDLIDFHVAVESNFIYRIDLEPNRPSSIFRRKRFSDL